MPILTFLCSCGHEFEKIMPAHQALYKWCNICDKLTTWDTKNVHKIVQCSICSKDKLTKSVSTTDSDPIEDAPKAICPSCGGLANHQIRIERRGGHIGGPNIKDSSVVFRFNYLSPEDS
jgi:hypothetical protein